MQSASRGRRRWRRCRRPCRPHAYLRFRRRAACQRRRKKTRGEFPCVSERQRKGRKERDPATTIASEEEEERRQHASRRLRRRTCPGPRCRLLSSSPPPLQSPQQPRQRAKPSCLLLSSWRGGASERGAACRTGGLLSNEGVIEAKERQDGKKRVSSFSRLCPTTLVSEPFSEGVEKKKTQKEKTLSRLCFFSEMAGLEALLFNAQDGYLGKTERKKERERREERRRKMPRVSFFVASFSTPFDAQRSFTSFPKQQRPSSAATRQDC